jgi:Protein of unknown function (DUF3891)
VIVREEPDGSLVLINQTDHAKVSGYFAAHWGNQNFERPHPYEPVVRGAIYHDAGWNRYETSPRCDPKTGAVPNFLQVPPDSNQLAAFQWAIDWMTAIDPYAGLLISMHRTGLWRSRYEAISHPPFSNAQLGPSVEAFVAENEAKQKQQEKGFDARELRVNYRLLQFWDLLSLYFCVRAPVNQYIEPVPRTYGEAQGVRVTLNVLGANKVAIDPYPFDAPELTVDVVHRRLPRARFANEAEFRAAYYRAPFQIMHFELVAS